MALFGKLFEKKICSICGNEIKLLGNRKLEDGNMCKDCAEKLSPWFSDRRSSTVESIKEQLAYREENKKAVQEFHATLTYGKNTKVMIDEDAGKFLVTRAHILKDANPDVLDFSQVTGCDLDIDEDKSEEKKKDKDGNLVSYNPPRYIFGYSFKIIIRVNHPYFDTISFSLTPSDVQTNEGNPLPLNQKPDPHTDQDYIEYEKMGHAIKKALTSGRKHAREEAAAAVQPKVAVTCPSCGASTLPDANGCCEYCGASLR